MAALEKLNGLNNGTEERKEIVCRERRLFWRIYNRTTRNLKIPAKIPIKGTTGSYTSSKPYALWKKLILLKAVDFYKKTSRKADKINTSQRGNKELCWKGDGWDGLSPLSCAGLQKSVGMAWGPGHTALMLLLPKATRRSKRVEKSEKKKYTWLYYLQLFTATKRARILIRFQNLLGMCERRMNQSRRA